MSANDPKRTLVVASGTTMRRRDFIKFVGSARFSHWRDNSSTDERFDLHQCCWRRTEVPFHAQQDYASLTVRDAF
jgi:hypothetical protein